MSSNGGGGGVRTDEYAMGSDGSDGDYGSDGNDGYGGNATFTTSTTSTSLSSSLSTSTTSTSAAPQQQTLVVMELMDHKSIDLLEYSCGRRVVALPSNLFNARRCVFGWVCLMHDGVCLGGCV